MKSFHALILAIGFVLGGVLVSGSNLVWNRYEYLLNPMSERLLRVDKATGRVYVFSKDKGWIDAQTP